MIPLPCSWPVSGVEIQTVCGGTVCRARCVAGLRLDQPLGRHDGVVRGARYFTCAPRHGLLVRAERVQPPCQPSQSSRPRPPEQQDDVDRASPPGALRQHCPVPMGCAPCLSYAFGCPRTMTGKTANRFLQRASVLVDSSFSRASPSSVATPPQAAATGTSNCLRFPPPALSITLSHDDDGSLNLPATVA